MVTDKVWQNRTRLIVTGVAVFIAASTVAVTTVGARGISGRQIHAGSQPIAVVAAENFWGSIAAQLGGKKVTVQSIITNPSTDPHAYEPTPADARSIAMAQMVIVNGVGYDPWAPKLIAADPGSRMVLDVGTLLRLPDGANPHRWYNPTDVQTVVRSIVGDYSKIDPKDAAYFSNQARLFNTVSLKPYETAVREIKTKYSGVPVGASESIFSMLAPALGLKLVTPYSFLRAISEGTDVSAGDKTTIDKQITHHLIKIYVYNSQNATPDITAQLAACKAAHIPTATITETLAPASSTYEAWQTRELHGILAALQKASGQ